MEHWKFHGRTGNDYGIDIEFELSENNEWENNKIEGQIKGTNSFKILSDNDFITFALKTYTIRYALNSPYSFVLFVVDVVIVKVYYLPIQEYFIYNKELILKIELQKTINVHIPLANIIDKSDDYDLQQIAKIGITIGIYNILGFTNNPVSRIYKQNKI